MGALIDHTTIPNHTFRNVEQPHVPDLVQSMNDFGLSYNSGMIVITASKESNPSESINELSFNNLIKDGALLPEIRACVLDGLHRRGAVLEIKNDANRDKSKTRWSDEHLRMILVLRRDSVDMSQTELLTWSSHENTKTITVRESHKTFSEKMHTAMAYYLSFFQDYEIPEGQIHRVVDVSCSMKNAGVCRGVSDETAKRIVRVCRYFLKHQGIYEHWVNIEREDWKLSLGVTHLDESAYQELDKEGVILFMDSAAVYIRNEALGKAGKKKADTRGPFPCRPFYESARSIYDICCQLHEQYCTRARLTFQEFLSSEIYLTPSKKVTIRNLFISQMKLFSYYSRNERENQTNSNRRESTLTREITAHVQFLNITCIPSTGTAVTIPHTDPVSRRQPPRASATDVAASGPTLSKRARRKTNRLMDELNESQPPRKKQTQEFSSSATTTLPSELRRRVRLGYPVLRGQRRSVRKIVKKKWRISVPKRKKMKVNNMVDLMMFKVLLYVLELMKYHPSRVIWTHRGRNTLPYPLPLSMKHELKVLWKCKKRHGFVQFTSTRSTEPIFSSIWTTVFSSIEWHGILLVNDIFNS